ncbi:hypothetical protein T265_11129 [Opisthorchis viverrini]|uniref:Reverse transcriptase domain-containing protein n=1 Tax=Opisthorchis viverrini TaxID=6198 RepID=A0A074YZS1_OPIVI|nr:hypothetical protein T265_11129 [Opisthorchis viverrini]KER20286.1 hypothetical protein T265_11129 [Opisthorchis viverrini]
MIQEMLNLFASLITNGGGAISSKPLTDSFGWTEEEVCVHQDIQELNRLLFEQIEIALKGTDETNLISDLFRGVQCTRDINLSVMDHDSVEDSLAAHTQMERLTGENQYFCDGCRCKVDAIKVLKQRHMYRRPTILMFLDFKDAFDSVNRPLLSTILAPEVCKPNPIPIFTHFGAVIDEIMKRTLDGLQNSSVPIVADESLVDLGYADDMALIFEDQSEAQTLLNKLTTIIPSFGMRLVPSKCKVMLQNVSSANVLQCGKSSRIIDYDGSVMCYACQNTVYRGGRRMTWQKGVKEITKSLGVVGVVRLRGWGPRDPACAWLENIYIYIRQSNTSANTDVTVFDDDDDDAAELTIDTEIAVDKIACGPSGSLSSFLLVPWKQLAVRLHVLAARAAHRKLSIIRLASQPGCSSVLIALISI